MAGANIQFNRNLRLLAEWGVFLKSEMKKIDAKLARQGGKSGASPSDEPAAPLSASAPPPPEPVAAPKQAAPKQKEADDDDAWLDELEVADDNQVDPPTKKAKAEPMAAKTAAKPESVEPDVVIF